MSVIKIGEQAGDLLFPRLVNFRKPTASSKQFRGKMLLLTTWATYCSPCIAAMPSLVSLQQHFADKIQVILVSPESVQTVNQFYARRPQLKLPTVPSVKTYKDIAGKFGVPSLGVVIAIDAEGAFRGFSYDKDLNSSKLRSLLTQKDTRLSLFTDATPNDTTKVTQERIDFILKDNSQEVQWMQFKSLLARGSVGFGVGTGLYSAGTIKDLAGRRVSAYSLPISGLFRIAYSEAIEGPWNTPPDKRDQPAYWGLRMLPQYRVIIEARDFERITDGARNENLYSYRLVVPPERSQQIYQIMRSDLERYFSLVGGVETRRVWVWVITRIGGGPSRSNNDDPIFQFTPVDLTMKNQPLSRFAQALEEQLRTPVFDESGLPFNVDLQLDNVIMKDPPAVNEALLKYGLSLQAMEREMPMLVIRDLDPNKNGWRLHAGESK
jgi:thiol-disulfide isomerase/thioredoxin